MTSSNLTAVRGISHPRGSSSPSPSRSNTSDDRVRRRLDALKASLEPAMKEGEQLLASFSKSLNEFLDDIQSEVLHGETHHMIYSFVDTVSIVSSALLEGSIASEAIHAKLESEIFRLAAVEFKNLSIHDRAPESASVPPAPYIEECYKWLLSHLHNPYPTKSARSQFSQKSGASEKDIDAWFINVRKRIGWNDIRRAHFETRFDMVKAATRFFQPTRRATRNSDDASSPDLQDYGAHFMAMKAEAEALYAHKFIPTTLATNLEKAMNSSKRNASRVYPSPERSPSRSAETPPPFLDKQRKRRSSDADLESIAHGESLLPQRPTKRIRTTSSSIAYANCRSTLPSPAPSIDRELSYAVSPSVAPSLLAEAEAPMPLEQRSNLKRRHSEVSSDYDSDSLDVPRSGRRRRLTRPVGDDKHCHLSRNSPIPSCTTEVSGLSHVTTSSQSRTSIISPSDQHPASPTCAVPASPTLKRKRRLSDADGNRPPKHPQHAALVMPRLQVVSNPLPTSSKTSAIDFLITDLVNYTPPPANSTSEDDVFQGFDLELGTFQYDNGLSLGDVFNSNHGSAHNSSSLSNSVISSENIIKGHQASPAIALSTSMSQSHLDAMQSFHLSHKGISQTTLPPHSQELYTSVGLPSNVQNCATFPAVEQPPSAPTVDLLADFDAVWQAVALSEISLSTQQVPTEQNVVNRIFCHPPTIAPQDTLLPHLAHLPPMNTTYPIETTNSFPLNGFNVYHSDKLAKHQKMQELLAQVEVLRSELSH